MLTVQPSLLFQGPRPNITMVVDAGQYLYAQLSFGTKCLTVLGNLNSGSLIYHDSDAVVGS